ncbi:MAG: ankyrin repeat domain-containing protein [Synergistaceae bacterium]|nr:ankyrin repeat domain-containing protein [Synergistaceae bacterium]
MSFINNSIRKSYVNKLFWAFIAVFFIVSSAFGSSTDDLFNAIKDGSITVRQFNTLRKHGASLRAKDEHNLTALMWAVALKHDPKLIRAMIQAGADVNAKGEDGNTPLMNAAFGRAVWYYGLYGSDSDVLKITPEVARVLIDAGAKVNARNNNGLTPLHHAVHASAGVVNVLLWAGADVNARDNEGYSPLMYAVTESDIDTIRALLDAGANPNLQENKYGLTALMRASFTSEGKPEIAGLLVRYGADIYLEDWDGKNVLEHDLTDPVRAAIVNSVR